MRVRRRGGLHPSLIGLLMVVGIVLFTYVAFHRGLPFTHRYQIHAVFRDANQVRKQSPVRIAGVDVGEVATVKRGPGQTSDVTIRLLPTGRPIHTDATARILPRVFLEGGFYIDVSPGSPSAPLLNDGDTIPVAQTTEPVQLHQVLAAFDKPSRDAVRKILFETSAALGQGGAEGLRAAAPELTPALRDVAWVSRALQGTAARDVSTAVTGSARAIGALADHEFALGGLVANLDTTARALASQDGALGAGIEQLRNVLRASPAALSALDSSLPAVVRLSRALVPSLRSSPPVLDEVVTAVRELGALVRPGPRERLVKSLAAALRDVPVLVQRLDGLFPVAKPVTDCLTSNILPILTSKVPDGALSSGRPVWQDFAHATVGLAGASANFDGNGYAVRYLGGGGTDTLSTGTIPGVGTLVGTLPGGGGGVQGVRPVWLGPDKKPPFRTDVPCSTQKLPNLATAAGASDLRRIGPSKRIHGMTVGKLRKLLAPQRILRLTRKGGKG